MQINTKSLVSMTEANQNFSKVAHLVEENGLAIVLKNNYPRYVVLDYSKFTKLEDMENELIESIAKKVLDQNLEAFKELAE